MHGEVRGGHLMEIVCTAKASEDALDALLSLYKLDTKEQLITAICEEILFQAAWQCHKQFDASLLTVRTALNKVPVSEIASRVEEMARKENEK
jgi:hypothetical protein